MAATKAEKFVTLLGDKLKQLPNLELTQDELQDKLETAIATLPNGALKGTLQRNIGVYTKLLGRLLELTLSRRTGDRLLCEADYDVLLSQQNTSKLVELLCAPPDIFFEFMTPLSLPKNDPKKTVYVIAQYCNAAAQELASNGFTSVYPSKQSPGNVFALYANKIVDGVRSWMDNVLETKANVDDCDARRLQSLLKSFLDNVAVSQLISPGGLDLSSSFYLPNPVATDVVSDSSKSIAHLYATYLVLVVFYPTQKLQESKPSDDSDEEDDSPAQRLDATGIAQQTVGELLMASEQYSGASWLADVLLFAAYLPHPVQSHKDALLAQYNRVVVQLLRRLSFTNNMSCIDFVNGVLCVRQAKEALRRTRQTNSRELTSVLARLSSMAIPFKLIDWMKLTSLGDQSHLADEVSKVLSNTTGTCSVFLTWSEKDLAALASKIETEFLVSTSAQENQAVISDQDHATEDNEAPVEDQPLFFVDNVGSN
ncbi:unnamed protein product [Aphanomyces euteiches]|uniref:Uncharacterized protein n=1 Tax=Aphanomyces euteiches TaxID=100861 RepID=A0A6G0WMV8_9STRA|nr:hypothetical protein Ae201684_013645 [Aphanomyces euteiches]